MSRKTVRWSLQDAKAQFSEVVRRSIDSGPQHVTRNGKDAVVVVSAAEYARMKRLRTESLGAMLARSPLAHVDLEIARPRDSGRSVKV